jgi:F420-non-reducing hydrogenase iron-sulfur subunit
MSVVERNAMSAVNNESAFEPELILLYCKQVLAQTAKPFEGMLPGKGFSARFVVMPCSSKMEPPHLLKVLEKGHDGALLVACPEGNCRFLVGNARAEKRIAYVRGLLDQVGMGAERLALERGQELSVEGLLDMAAGRVSQVINLGPNPLKGESPR